MALPPSTKERFGSLVGKSVRIREIFAASRDHLCAMLTPAQKPKFNALLRRWESAHDAIAPPFLSMSSAGSAPAHEGAAPGEDCS